MNDHSNAYLNQLSAGEVFDKLMPVYTYLRKKYLIILLVSFLGGLIGYLYAYFQPKQYLAKSIFIVEDGKGGSGGIAALAGQFGFDLGGGGGASILSSDNSQFFLRSESLCREVLLSIYDEESKLTLADKLAEVSGFTDVWKKNPTYRNETFFSTAGNINSNRSADSLLHQLISGELLKNDLTIARPDTKASFIEVRTKTPDEKLSMLITERLVKIAADKYVKVKTAVKALNVASMQRRADSLSAILNNKTINAAASRQNFIDINPAMKLAPIRAEISEREKTLASTIFAEVTKNLEISKTLLNQETPVIQVVDQSYYPLEVVKTSKLKFAVILSLIFFLITCSFLIFSSRGRIYATK